MSCCVVCVCMLQNGKKPKGNYTKAETSLSPSLTRILESIEHIQSIIYISIIYSICMPVLEKCRNGDEAPAIEGWGRSTCRGGRRKSLHLQPPHEA